MAGTNYARHSPRKKRIRKPAPRHANVTMEKQEAVLAVILKYIGKACPTNAQISEECGFSFATVSRSLSALYSRGVLAYEVRGNDRIITIT